MKHQNKELYKAIERCAKDRMKAIRKAYGYRTRDFANYKVDRDFFISMGIFPFRDRITITLKLKPMFLDEIFWDVFDMPGNKNEPLSLRAVGAFSVSAPIFYKDERAFESCDGVGEYIEESLKKCDEIARNVVDVYESDYKSFFDHVRNENLFTFDLDLSEMLLAIKEERYIDAEKRVIQLLEKGERGRFGTGNKYIYHYILDYCIERS